MTWVLLGGVSWAQEASPTAETITLRRDVIYGTIEGVQLTMDIALPKSGNGAAVLLIHGGGWSEGDKSQLAGEIKTMARRGYVAASVGYRLAPMYRFPAAVHDVRLAVRYLRRQASELGFEPERIGAVGFSAGAHLAMMLATTDADDFELVGGLEDQSPKVAAAVSYFGPTQLTSDSIPAPSVEILRRFLGASRDENPAVYRTASPITYLDSSDCPMLLFQGTTDPLVPYGQAIEMMRAMDENNIAGRVEIIAGASHGWGGQELDRTRAATMEFLHRYVVSQP